MSKSCLILIGHGSKLPYNRETIEEFVGILRKGAKFESVKNCFMVINKPSIPEILDKLVEDGFTKIVLIPTFLAHGVHTKQEIPEILQEKRDEYASKSKQVEIIYGDPFGADERIAQVLEEKALKLLGEETDDVTKVQQARNLTAATNMYQTSMEIIRPLIKETLQKVPQNHVPVIERVVHTTADPEFAKLVVIKNSAVESGVAAIKSGAKIITDVKMVKAGINPTRVKRFGGQILTYVDDDRAIKLAKQESITRSAAAMRLAIKDGLDNSIIAIGNAPTAAFEISKAVKQGLVKPALIIATPVGYVGAAESKEEVTTLPVPNVIVRGPKGGSALAVAVFNALLNMAEEASKN
ncbi:MAG: sirohydrochlorin nickelochelatase [Candidatus Bathyarchaeota archaeon]|nr:sirohydrochlorin nickelochelatase [Candidatus Bathyarchaeota archaeon]